ncbi:MAG: hypothetical protein OXT09_18450 [Myxococcales bacterium]|nr:hypothetical protein [Myxococcales bacterium]
MAQLVARRFASGTMVWWLARTAGALALVTASAACSGEDGGQGNEASGIGAAPNAGQAPGNTPGNATPTGAAGGQAPTAVPQSCGNGQLDEGESCDPAATCPSSCDDGDACTQDALSGSAATCDAACMHTPIAACVPDDGCCPAGCDSNQDSDCEPQCGNGVLEEGELCDPLESCPTECDDGDPCTTGTLTGDAASCSAACEQERTPGCAADHLRGARVGSVYIDQGVRITLAEGGSAIERDARRAEIVAGRPGLLRASLAIDPDWTPRAVRAVLTLTRPDGSEEALEASAQVAAESIDYDNVDDGLVWRLPGDTIVPELEYAIELFEVDDSRNLEPLPDAAPRLPLEGAVELGVDDTYMKMRVMLVPLDHDLGPDCPEPPDLHAIAFDTRTEAQYIGERIYALNPVDEVEVVVHEVVPYQGSATSSGPIFTLLRQLRESDNADPGWYYYALIRPCDGGPNFSGVASLGRPDRSAANQRTGWGVYRDEGRHALTTVHELGHQQGRNHVLCSGSEGGPDPDYPNNDGDTDVWGFDVLSDDRVLDPDRHDYMSYCGQTWVSEYGWNFVYPRIATISGWELEHSAQPEVPLLHVMVHPTGPQEVWIGRGYAPDPSAGHSLIFYDGDQMLAEVPAHHEAIPKGGSFQLTVPLPDAYEGASQVLWRHDAALRAVELQRVVEVR